MPRMARVGIHGVAYRVMQVMVPYFRGCRERRRPRRQLRVRTRALPD